MKTKAIKHPSMPKTSTFSVKLREREEAKEGDLEQQMPPQKRQMLADGGEVGSQSTWHDGKTPYEALSADKKAYYGSKSNYDSYDATKKQSADTKDSEPVEKFAKGGPVSAVFEHERPDEQLEAGAADDSSDDTEYAAEGGMMGDDELEMEHHASVADAIMSRRKYAEGGMVDLDSNEEESPADPSEFDEMNEKAALKENYDETMDKLDRVSAIRKRMKR